MSGDVKRYQKMLQIHQRKNYQPSKQHAPCFQFSNAASKYVLKVNDKNTSKKSEICSNLTIKKQ